MGTSFFADFSANSRFYFFDEQAIGFPFKVCFNQKQILIVGSFDHSDFKRKWVPNFLLIVLGVFMQAPAFAELFKQLG